MELDLIYHDFFGSNNKPSKGFDPSFDKSMSNITNITALQTALLTYLAGCIKMPSFAEIDVAICSISDAIFEL